MTMTLQQSTLAVVTGAASGIGKATALRLLEQKARVVALDRNQESLDALMSETQSHGIIPCCFDLQKIEAIPKLISDLTESHGPITQLVNNAGVWDGGPITEMSDQVWRLNFDVNVFNPA
jgi:NADP-dependent 3-hydroxy acid dehydrogenase YdfG